MGAAAAAPPISARTTAPSPIRPIISAPPAVTPTSPLKLLTIQHIEHRAAEAEKSSLLGPVLQLAQLGAPVGPELRVALVDDPCDPAAEDAVDRRGAGRDARHGTVDELLAAAGGHGRPRDAER